MNLKKRLLCHILFKTPQIAKNNTLIRLFSTIICDIEKARLEKITSPATAAFRRQLPGTLMFVELSKCVSNWDCHAVSRNTDIDVPGRCSNGYFCPRVIWDILWLITLGDTYHHVTWLVLPTLDDSNWCWTFIPQNPSSARMRRYRGRLLQKQRK